MKQTLTNAKTKQRYNDNAKGNGFDKNAPLLLLCPDNADNNDEDDTPHLSQPHYSNATAMNILTVTVNGPH